MPPEINTLNTLVTLCSSFTCICIAVGWVIKIVAGLRQPEVNQNARIEALENDIAEIRSCLGNDNNRIRSMEHGNRIILESLQALINHAIDGNNTEELRAKSKDLNTYLYDKGFTNN